MQKVEKKNSNMWKFSRVQYDMIPRINLLVLYVQYVIVDLEFLLIIAKEWSSIHSQIHPTGGSSTHL